MKRIVACLVLFAVATHAADEINAVVTFKVTKGNLAYQQAVNKSFTVTNATPNMIGGTQTISPTNTSVAISVTALTTPGWAYFRNLTTNANRWVDLGTGSGSAWHTFARLKAGEYGLIRLATNAVYARSWGGAVILEKTIVDD